jgi:hypothetical protein
MRNDNAAAIGVLGLFGFGFALFAAWLTHVIVCFKTASWGFLIAGAIFAPVGIVHGVGVWFGAW